MDRIKELGLDVRTFFNAKPAFIAGVLDAMQVSGFFDQAIGATKQTGRPQKISDGTIAKLMLINICDNYHPLYRLQEYFLDKDIKLLAGEHAELDLLHDDRFGDLLDRMFEAGPRAIFSAIATSAFPNTVSAFAVSTTIRPRRSCGGNTRVMMDVSAPSPLP